MKVDVDATRRSRHPWPPVLGMTAAASAESKGLTSLIAGGDTIGAAHRPMEEKLGTGTPPWVIYPDEDALHLLCV